MKAKIKKYLEGKASREEILSLIHWLDVGENQSEFKRVKSEWKANIDEQNLTTHTLSELDKFNSMLLHDRNEKLRKLKSIHNFYKYAALLFLFISIGSVYLYNADKEEKQTVIYNTVIAENGQISKVVLPDSSTVWLNSGSSLKYNNQFGIKNRVIELIGQAYFDVTKNRKLPLIVSCGKINVKVLGTRFTAETYPDDLEISVVLIEGSIELTDANSKKTFANLHPNEMMVYNKQDNKFQIRKVVAEKYTSWREGIIHIYDQPLIDAVAKLQKRYNQQIILEKALEDYKVTFSIRNEDFNTVLEMLMAITPAKAYQEGEIIYIKRNR